MAAYPHAELTERVIGTAIEVHRALGPGLLESAYEACLAVELELRGVACQRQVSLPIAYRGRSIDASYRINLLIEVAVIVDLKSDEQVTPIHEAQLLTYLKLAGKRVGLLINFNTDLLKNGVTRRVL